MLRVYCVLCECSRGRGYSMCLKVCGVRNHTHFCLLYLLTLHTHTYTHLHTPPYTYTYLHTATRTTHTSFDNKYAFLYHGYTVNDTSRPHVYAWECVVTIRKLLVVCAAVYLHENPSVQGECVLTCVYIKLFWSVNICSHTHTYTNHPVLDGSTVYTHTHTHIQSLAVF
jgi:hypothetical protein